MARINGSGFKMKSSPTKGKLGNFFSSLGSQLKEGQKERGIFSEAGKAEKKERRAGESKFKADVRRRGETNKAKKSMVDEDKDGMSDFIQAPKKTPKGQEVVSSSRVADGNYFNFSGKKGDKYKYRTKSYINPYNNQLIPGDKETDDVSYEFQRPGSNTWEKSKTIAGNQAIDDLFFSDDVYGKFTKNKRERRTNSDYKGGMPPLKKKGYKMKKSPAKNYKEGYYGVK